MAYQVIDNVRITGISACVPKNKESNEDYPQFKDGAEAKRFIKNTGVKERRVTTPSVCSSDLCYHAAEKLISESKIEKEQIDCLIFITQTPDYIVPMTASGLQHKLGLTNECYSFDVTLGCSAWVYGLSIMGALLSNGWFKNGLLLVGETTTKTKSKEDKSIYPLFGDAGSATLMKFDKAAPPLKFHAGTDGAKQKAIYIPDGGFRSPTTEESLKYEKDGEGVNKNRLQYIMNGAEVFTFTITKVPKSIKGLMKKFDVTQNEIDYFLLHQANKMIVDKVAKKVGAKPEQVLTSLEKFGNTSCASIPLTLVTSISEEVSKSKLNFVASGFGSGLSLASALFSTENIICPKLIEI